MSSLFVNHKQMIIIIKNIKESIQYSHRLKKKTMNLILITVTNVKLDS